MSAPAGVFAQASAIATLAASGTANPTMLILLSLGVAAGVVSAPPAADAAPQADNAIAVATVKYRACLRGVGIEQILQNVDQVNQQFVKCCSKL